MPTLLEREGYEAHAKHTPRKDNPHLLDAQEWDRGWVNRQRDQMNLFGEYDMADRIKPSRSRGRWAAMSRRPIHSATVAALDALVARVAELEEQNAVLEVRVARLADMLVGDGVVGGGHAVSPSGRTVTNLKFRVCKIIRWLKEWL